MIEVFRAIYSDLEDFIDALLSTILNFFKYYYFPEEINRIQKLHRMLGLEEDCGFSEKVELEVMALGKIL